MIKFNIVTYGDSNTYGYSPDGSRYTDRYSVVLNRLLGEDYIVHEEGVVGRTTVYSDIREGRIGVDSINDELAKYDKIDLLIIMLGTNDYKIKNARLLSEIEYGMDSLLQKVIKLNNLSKILLISPILLAKNIDILDKEFDHNSYILSECAATVYESLAKKYNINFFDAKLVAYPGSDGEHFTQESHISLANSLAEIIRGVDLI